MISSPISTTVRSPFATVPAWSMLGVLAGGLASIVLIPDEGGFGPDTLKPAALALAAGLLAGPAVAVARSARSAFRAEHLLCFGLVYWLLLDILLGQARVTAVSYAAIAQSFAAIAVFTIALWIGSATASVGVSAPAALRGPTHDLTPRFLFIAAIVSAGLGLSRVLVGCGFSPSCVVDAFYQPRFSAVWFRVDTFGHFDTLFLYSRYFGFLVLPLTVALVAGEGRFTWRSVSTLLLGMVCLVFMVGDGGRRDVGTAVGASLLVWALMKRHVGLRQLVGISILAGTLVFLMQFMLVARGVGLAVAIEQGTDLSRRDTPVGTVDRNFRFLSSIVQLVPDRYPHSGWKGVAYSATVWVPGGLVPREWQRRSIDLPALLGMQVGPGYSWTCSVVGDLYLIGGIPVVALGGLFFGAMGRFAGRLLGGGGSSQQPILYSLMVMTLFLSLRALHEIFVTGFVAVAFALLLAVRHVLFRDSTDAHSAPSSQHAVRNLVRDVRLPP